MKRHRYEWKDEAPGFYQRFDADKIGREFMKIKDENGDIHPAAVVAYARNPNSEMHNFFEWNNSAAAERYRNWQARNMIACITEVKVTVKDKKVIREKVRLLFPVKRGTNRGYSYADEIKKDREKVQEIIANARSDMEAWMKTYDRICKQFDEIYENAKENYQKPSHSKYHK